MHTFVFEDACSLWQSYSTACVLIKMLACAVIHSDRYRIIEWYNFLQRTMKETRSLSVTRFTLGKYMFTAQVAHNHCICYRNK